MLNKNQLYVNKILQGEDDHYMVGLLKKSILNDDEFIRVGVPIIISAREYNDLLNKKVSLSEDLKSLLTADEYDLGPYNQKFIKGYVKYAFNSASLYEWYVNVDINNLYMLGKKAWFPNYHVVLNLDFFDVRRVNMLMEAVMSRGAVTLFFKKEAGGRKALDLLDILARKYKYNFLLYHHLSGSKKNAHIAMDIVNIYNSWPIFNTKRCNGIQIRLYGVPEMRNKSCIERGSLISPIEIIYSDHKSNIVDLDGEPLLKPSTIHFSDLKSPFLDSISYPSDHSDSGNSQENNNKGSQRKPAPTLKGYSNWSSLTSTTTYGF